MRLLFVHQYLGAFGGAEADILRAGNTLVSRGHSVRLLYAERTGRGEQEWLATFADHVSLSDADAPAKALEGFAPDAIYFHSLSGCDVLQQMLAAGVPVVRKLHDHSLYCLRGSKYSYFTRRVCARPASFRCVFPCLAVVGRNRNGRLPFTWVSYRAKREELELNRRCACLIVYSNYQAQELLRNGFDLSRIAVHPPVQVWRADPPESSFSPRNLVLFAGQLVRGKGVDLLLRALAKLRVPFECEILGDGNHRGCCERLARRLGLQERVRFRGFLPQAQMAAFYREASVLAFSSVWPEPFGMVGREAMLHGLPVVAFQAGAVREWLRDGETGFVVPPKDVAAFADRLEKLLTDKALARRLGRRGREEMQSLRTADRGEDLLEDTFIRVTKPTKRTITK